MTPTPRSGQWPLGLGVGDRSGTQMGFDVRVILNTQIHCQGSSMRTFLVPVQISSFS